MKKYKVTFYPYNKSVEVLEGTTILSAALSGGIYINSICAGDGLCGKCRVFIRKTSGKKSCLACQATINSNLDVDIPLESRLDSPQLENNLFQLSDNQESATYISGDFGLAVDIGTTTISAEIININEKSSLGVKTSYNRQASFGADIITRIIYATGSDGLDKLQRAVVFTINQLIRALALENKVNIKDVDFMVCAGNTTMIHLLLKKNPAYIRRDSFDPLKDNLPSLKAKEIGIDINPSGVIYSIPAVASYVGGDTVAGILSSGLYMKKGISMLIDIGTNGEIALGNEEFIVSSAASAGPAFEGSGLKNGMRALPGAIEKVTIDPKNLSIDYKVIGGAQPLGICGSGYISLLRNMLACGIIDKGGKIIKEDKRIRNSDFGKEFIVCFKEDSLTKEEITVSEADLDNLKRAKAAIYSAASILLKHMNFNVTDLENIFISGGFGTSLDIDSAIAIGLLPDADRSIFSFLGNSALAGAKEVLLSAEKLKRAEELARQITYFDLSTDAEYMNEYMAALFFPHTDLGRFPSIKNN